MYPQLLKIGSFVVNSHDFFLGMAFFLGTVLFLREIKRDNEDQVKLLNLAIFIIIFSIVGARLFHVLLEIRFYSKHPLNVLMIWNGGWVFYGGFLAAVAGGVVYIKKAKMNLWRTIDIVAPSVTFGLVFGRIACFMTGCCYGKICSPDLPFGVSFKIVNYVRPQASPLNTPLYPTQIMEGIVCLALFFFFLFYRAKKKFHGELAGIFLIVYPITRFIIEFFRGDEVRGLWLGDTLSTSQIISIPLLILGAWILFRNKPDLI